MIPALPMAQPVRGWSTLGVARYSSFAQRTPAQSTVARAARSPASMVANVRSPRASSSVATDTVLATHSRPGSSAEPASAPSARSHQLTSAPDPNA